MKLQYHSDSDLHYIKLGEGTSNESEEIAPRVVLDFHASNRVIGVEIEDASKFIALSRLELKSLPLANLIFSGSMPTHS